MEDGNIIFYLIQHINQYRFNNHFNNIKQISKDINTTLHIADLDEYLHINNSNDINNVGNIFIKITAFNYSLNYIRLNKLYRNYIIENEELINENSFIFSIIKDNDLTSKTFLITYYKICKILENNNNYNIEFEDNLNTMNDILIY